MADIADRASELEQIQRDISIRSHAATTPKRAVKVLVCVDCGFDIEPARVLLDADRCAECVTYFEKEQRLKGK